MRSYTLWTWHEEVLDKPTTSWWTDYVDQWMDDHLEDMVRDVREENFEKAHQVINFCVSTYELDMWLFSLSSLV